MQKTSEVDRQDAGREKTGIPLERYAINPVNGERIPVWTADYVLADYGHGAVMAVPAHDQRDLDFALKFGLPVKVVVDTNAAVTGTIPVITPEMLEEGAEIPALDPAGTGVALNGPGRMINSGPLDGLSKQNAISRVIDLLTDAGTGRAAKTYRLRDWLISRQRYWGTPIPILHAEDGSLHPVPEDQLPLELPPTEGLDLKPRASRRSARRRSGCRPRCPTAGRPVAIRTRWTRSSTAPGTSCATSTRTTTPAPSSRRMRRSGRPSTSTSAGSSTRSCTCCTRASSRRCCSTSAT
ncbi:hypothetical protein GCM10025881_33860 [Pseudolysinimonas kribbensis]|uniref:leucine--tRNA ligase n=1 Tax=Pseudolysinimonas kribbensis TaxID=433641 RepID=A0ABQ6K9E3_9MICO|nr:hypothetical protein GCM10025881_33860 [Pseudolysinimonas kribbensis]